MIKDADVTGPPTGSTTEDSTETELETITKPNDDSPAETSDSVEAEADAEAGDVNETASGSATAATTTTAPATATATDTKSKAPTRQVSREEAEAYAKEAGGLLFFEASAKTGQGVQELFTEIGKLDRIIKQEGRKNARER